jgi:hypothetical protein
MFLTSLIPYFVLGSPKGLRSMAAAAALCLPLISGGCILLEPSPHSYAIPQHGLSLCVSPSSN